MEKFTSINDVLNLNQLVQRARALKARPFESTVGRERTLVLLFFNPSLRTRLSTEKAGLNLGMQVISMNAAQGWKLEFEDGAVMNLDRTEHIREAAAVISQYADVIGVRTFPSLTDRERDYADTVLNSFVAHARVPVLSLESAIRHPLQSLSDVMTIQEHSKTDRPRVVLSWAPHPKALPQAVANSFVEWIKAADMDLVVTHPKGYELAPPFVTGVKIEYDQLKAFEGAEFVYAKNWSAYAPYGAILNQDTDWMITEEKLQQSKNAFFMHCLPVRRNVVVEDAVLNSPRSLVIEQAGNRTWAAQAVLEELLKQT